MAGHELAMLWIAWVVAGASPGPATLGIASAAMQCGRRAGLVFACGILFGGAVWGILAALGVSALMLTHAWMFEVLRYVGAAYLMYLAVKALRSALSHDAVPPLGAIGGKRLRLFTKAALIHLANPKAILSWGAVYAVVVPPGAEPAELAFIFAFLFSGGICVFTGYALLFSSPRIVAAYVRMRRWFEGLFAVLFGAAGLKILTTRLA